MELSADISNQQNTKKRYKTKRCHLNKKIFLVNNHDSFVVKMMREETQNTRHNKIKHEARKS
jgi:hypothetical protein